MTPLPAELPPKVLIVRLGAIGDVVNALVFAGALRSASTPVEIGWVVHPLAQPLVEGHPCVDRVHVWKKGGGVREFRRLVRELRGVGYGLAVDLQRIAKSALVARLSGAPRVLGYDRARAKECSWLLYGERIAPGFAHAHMADQYLEFASALGLPRPEPLHCLPRHTAADAWADERVREWGAAPLLLNLGATKPANRWQPERFGQLAASLATKPGCPVVFTGSAADREAEGLARAAAGEGSDVHSLVGETSLPELIALTARARAWVGCDTGPMHIATACGTPVVALFGPADPRRTGPYGQAQGVLRVPPPCAPCGRRTCNQPRHACMDDLTVELVASAVRARLETARST